MDCNCRGRKCYYRENISSRTNNIVTISCKCCELSGLLRPVLFYSDTAFFEYQKELKKIVFSNAMSNFSCKFSIKLDGYNHFEKIDKNLFLCCDENSIFIHSVLTGEKISHLTFAKEIESVCQVKYSSGFLIVETIDEENSVDINIYQLDNQKLVAENILQKFFDTNLVYYDLMLCVLKDGYFVSLFIHEDEKPAQLTMWKLSASSEQKCSFVDTVVIDHESPIGILKILYNDGCLSCVFSTFIELFQVKEDKLVHIKRVNKIMQSSSVKTMTIVPVYQFCALMVQYVEPHQTQRPGKSGDAFFTFHNFLNNKTHTITDLELFQCNPPFRKLNCCYIFKKSTFLFMGKKSFNLKLEAKDLAIVYHDIRKYARVLAQAIRTKTSKFCTLPLELVVHIICKTRNSDNNDDANVMRSVALSYF